MLCKGDECSCHAHQRVLGVVCCVCPVVAWCQLHATSGVPTLASRHSDRAVEPAYAANLHKQKQLAEPADKSVVQSSLTDHSFSPSPALYTFVKTCTASESLILAHVRQMEFHAPIKTTRPQLLFLLDSGEPHYIAYILRGLNLIKCGSIWSTAVSNLPYYDYYTI